MSWDFFKQSGCGTIGHFPSTEQKFPIRLPKDKAEAGGSTLGQLFLCLLGISGDKEKSGDTKLAEAVSARNVEEESGGRRRQEEPVFLDLVEKRAPSTSLWAELWACLARTAMKGFPTKKINC